MSNAVFRTNPDKVREFKPQTKKKVIKTLITIGKRLGEGSVALYKDMANTTKEPQRKFKKKGKGLGFGFGKPDKYTWHGF